MDTISCTLERCRVSRKLVRGAILVPTSGFVGRHLAVTVFAAKAARCGYSRVGRRVGPDAEGDRRRRRPPSRIIVGKWRASTTRIPGGSRGSGEDAGCPRRCVPRRKEGGCGSCGEPDLPSRERRIPTGYPPPVSPSAWRGARPAEPAGPRRRQVRRRRAASRPRPWRR